MCVKFDNSNACVFKDMGCDTNLLSFDSTSLCVELSEDIATEVMNVINVTKLSRARTCRTITYRIKPVDSVLYSKREPLWC
jgi:hypothetical protein